ncbi:MAG: molybdopterin-dependent oxidoreductase, partial [Serratia liquefaciens]|nr:molybdopterin-dependent oxidoreductase [Serratia liquefaciens]
MKTSQNISLSRRRFLTQLGGLTAIGMIGPSLLVPKSALAQGGLQEGILTGSHWGAIRATVMDGRFVAAKPFEMDKYPSERVQNTYGPSALLSGTGWQSTGMFHNAAGMLARALALHGDSVGTGGDYSTGAAQVILPRVVGSMEVYEQQTSWPLVLQHSKTLVLWGSDLVKNQQANWWCPDHDVYEYYNELKTKAASGEIKVVSIDPVVSSTHEFLGRENVQHIAVNPQTDVPLQLALAYTLYSENLHDTHFLKTYCVGFDQFLPYLLGQTD